MVASRSQRAVPSLCSLGLSEVSTRGTSSEHVLCPRLTSGDGRRPRPRLVLEELWATQHISHSSSCSVVTALMWPWACSVARELAPSTELLLFPQSEFDRKFQ